MGKPASRPAASADHYDQLSCAVGELADQVRVLRIAIDELREELQHAIRNRGADAPPTRFRLTSMPADPLAEDWAARLNRVRPEDISDSAPAEAISAPSPDMPPTEHSSTAPTASDAESTSTDQRRLWPKDGHLF